MMMVMEMKKIMKIVLGARGQSQRDHSGVNEGVSVFGSKW
jgi:hypothetical protein